MKPFYQLGFHVVLFLSLSSSIFGQICTPSTDTLYNGVWPLVADSGCVGQYYSETFTLFFRDSTLFPIDYDSVKINSVSGLPTGLSWECDQQASNCLYIHHPFPSDTIAYGCFSVSGTPQSDNLSHPFIGVELIFYFRIPGGSFIDTISQDQGLKIRTPGGNCATPLDPTYNSPSQLEVFPHPATDASVLRFELPEPTTVSWQILDLTGRTVEDQPPVELGTGSQTLPLAPLPIGSFLLRLKMDDQYLNKRIIKIGIAP